MSSIKGIIFDYGGTIDTNGIHWSEVIWQQYIKAGAGIDKALFRDAYVHGERSLAKSPIIESSDTFLTLLKKKIAIQFSFLKEHTGQEALTKELETTIADGCYRNVLQTIDTTRSIVMQLGMHYPMVLVTNFYGNMPVVLKEFGLDGLFRKIVESSVVGIRKPSPELFALGLEALGMEAGEIVVIGDSYKKDIYPSLTLGCRTVWLKKLCWEEELVMKGYEPTHTIESLEELPAIIENMP